MNYLKSILEISKKNRELVVEELKTWDLSGKAINQVYKLATNYINKEILI